jgi:hypothetical protein
MLGVRVLSESSRNTQINELYVSVSPDKTGMSLWCVVMAQLGRICQNRGMVIGMSCKKKTQVAFKFLFFCDKQNSHK